MQESIEKEDDERVLKKTTSILKTKLQRTCKHTKITNNKKVKENKGRRF